MINFKWSFVCIALVCGPTIASAYTDDPKWRTQVIRANSNATESICTSASTYYDFISNSKFFVDNSMLIEYVLRNPMTLIALPRKFGKSINIDMLKTFLEIEVDSITNQVVPKNQTKAFQIFKSGILRANGESIVLQPKFLIKDRDYAMDNMNSYPIIRLNMSNSCCSYDSFKDICEFIVARSKDAFKDHDYLKTVETRAGRDYQDALSDLHRVDCAKDYNRVADILGELSAALHHHFGTPVIMLIDDYDAILDKVFIESSGYTKDYRESVLGYFSHFFGTLLKGNSNVETALLTGIILWKNRGGMSAQFVFDVKTMAHDTPLHRLGISPENVVDMLKISNDGLLNDTAFNEMKSYYGGYLFGDTNRNMKFNPLSIARFFNNHQSLQGYWTETGAIRQLFKVLTKFENFNQKFLQLLLDGEVSVSNRAGRFTRMSIERFPELLAKAAHLNEDQWRYKQDQELFDDLFYVLYSSGYLTLSNRTTDSEVWLRIPNAEVKDYLWTAYYECLKDIRAIQPYTTSQGYRSKIEAFSNEYGKMILTDECDVTNFTKTFYEFSSTFLPLANNASFTYPNEKLIELFVESIHLTNYRQAHSQVQTVFTKRYPSGIPDLVSVFNGTLVVVEFKRCTESAQQALNQTQKYENIFLTHEDYSGSFKKMKKIGMAVHSNLSVEVMLQFGHLGQNNTIKWGQPAFDYFPKSTPST